jgi:hypothetical protein
VLYTFDFREAERAYEFATHVLTGRQAQAVQRVHMDVQINGAQDLSCLVQGFPWVEKLELSLKKSAFNDGEPEEWDVFFKHSQLQTVEIVLYNDTRRHVVEHRRERRKATEAIERFLTSRSFEEGDKHIQAYHKAKAVAAGELWSRDEEDGEVEDVEDGS